MDSDNTLVTHHGTRTDEGLETRLLRGALERSMFDGGPAVKLGRFTVLEKIGAGGMGVVYAAHDPDLDRKVAVKVLRSLRTGALETERLFREAQAMARLSHPHVVTVHEVGVQDDHVFVAMEYVEGGTLADLIHSGQPCEKAKISPTVSLMRQCAQGLAAAHATGTVHRDFKPANVLLTVDGRAKIADFGLARFDDSEPDPAASDSLSSAGALAQRPPSGSSTASGSPSNRLTLTGDVLGTPAYMAPEQLDGVANVQTDQFSFCAAFYEVFYGHRPFKGDNLTELLVNIAEGRMENAPASSHVPGWLHQVLIRGLSLRPEDRYPDVSALSDALTVLVHAGDPFGLRRAAVLATQGQIHQQMQDLDKALELFEQALAIRKAALHPEHPTIATNLNDIATVLDGMGLLDLSMVMHTRALAIREAAFGPEHPLVASVLNNLAVGHARQAQFGPAAELFGRALRIDEGNLGPDHPRLVSALSNLGSVHHALQEYDRAKQLHARALSILENNPAPNKRQQAAVMHNLAQAQSALKEYSQARQLLERALVIQQDALGDDHPDIAATRNTLGFVLLELLEPGMALEQFEQALPIAPPQSVADSEHGIATSLWRGEVDRERARQWATRARKSYVALGAPALDNILVLDALLLELSPP